MADRYINFNEIYKNLKVLIFKIEKKIRGYFSARGADIYTRFIRRMFLFFILACFIAGLVSVLTLLISGLAKPLTKVPHIIGMNVVDAIEAVQDRGLIARLESKFDTNIERFSVIEQSPVSGITVKKDRIVIITVSMGKDIYRTPSLRGLKFENAEELLKNLRIGYEISVIKSSDYPLDTVISQDIAPDIETDRNVKMNLVVNSSIGINEYKVDDFTGQSVDSAVKTLVSASVIPIIEKVPTKDPSEDGIVLSQNIKEGSVVIRNSEIMIQVGVYGETDRDTAENNYYYFTYFMTRGPSPDSNSSLSNQDQPVLVKITKSDEQVQQDEIYNQNVKFGDNIILTFKAYGNTKLDLFVNSNFIKEIGYGTSN